jgi:hypothetical protein
MTTPGHTQNVRFTVDIINLDGHCRRISPTAMTSRHQIFICFCPSQDGQGAEEHQNALPQWLQKNESNFYWMRRRLLIKMETTHTNNKAFSNVTVEICEMFAHQICKQKKHTKLEALLFHPSGTELRDLASMKIQDF